MVTKDNGILIGHCPVCDEPVYAPRVAMTVGPWPKNPTCEHPEAYQVHSFIDDRREQSRPVWGDPEKDQCRWSCVV